MIPDIGLMIGCYIITKMFSMLVKGKEGKEHDFVWVLALITVIITVYATIDILLIGVK